MDYFDILLAKKLSGGGGGDITVEPITITENGTTTAPTGKAYSPIYTDVPLPDNAYLLKEVEDLPKDIATFTDGSNLPMPSLKIGIEPVQSGSGTPSPTNIRPISGWSGANVSVCGVNICGGKHMADNIKNNINSATIDETAKTVSFGYSSGGALADVITAFKTKENTRYTFIFSILNPSNARTNLCVLYTDGTTSVINMTKTNEKEIVVFTSTANKTVKSVNLQRQGGTTYIYYDESGIFEGTKTASDFVAYNGATYTIPFTDSQGNPIEVYGGECDVVNGTIKPNIEYDSYNGETLVGRWISDRDEYAEGTTPTIGAQVVDLGAYGSDISVQPTAIKSLEVNNVWGDCGNITELSYFFKPSEE